MLQVMLHARTHTRTHAHTRTHTRTQTRTRTHARAHTYTTHTQVRSDSYPSVAVSDEGDDADEAEANKKLVPVTFEVCVHTARGPGVSLCLFFLVFGVLACSLWLLFGGPGVLTVPFLICFYMC